MSEAHSVASKKRWSYVSAEERSKRMRHIALKKHAALSFEERQSMMVKVREAKKKYENT